MYKKVLSITLAVMLLAVGVVSPRIIDSFDNLLEKFNYIVAADAPFVTSEDTRQTYRSGKIDTDLNFKTVALTEKEAAKLGLSTAVEKDFVVKAENIDLAQYLYNHEGPEYELYEDYFLNNSNDTSDDIEGYTWNVPFVKGSEADINTLGNENVKVGILDSGVSLNDEFEDIVRIDLVPDTEYDSLGIYNDVTGHGTGVAGVIAAEKNDSGIIGIAPNVSVYSIRVLDEDNEAPISRIIAGIEWAIENDIDVLNMSFGTENYSAQLYNAVRRAYESGIVLVASAGNTGGESEQVTYPARFSEVIAVGSNDQNGKESDFSPNSADVDILAPGEYIDCIGLVNGYCVENGTSLAAPHVSAAAALVLSADGSKSPEFVKQLLVSTANVSQNSRGILDIKNALDTLPDFEDVEAIAPAEIPENTEEIENFEISEDVVVGSWWATKHTELIYGIDENGNFTSMGEFGELCDTTVGNIKLFAKAAYEADKMYGFSCVDSSGNQMKRFSPLHAVGYTSGIASDSRKTGDNGSMNSNYVADTKYLYRLALHFKTSASLADAKENMNDVTIANANYPILRAVVSSDHISSSGVIYTRRTGESGAYEYTNIKGICQSDIVDGVAESTPESVAWKILGLAAHLAADAYSHRIRVPVSSTTSTSGLFYSDDPLYDCFNGDNHYMEHGSIIGTRTPNLTNLKKVLKEQDTYHGTYVTNGTLCQCYDCLKEAIAEGRVECRDLSDKYLNKGTGYVYYDPDRTYFYPKRYTIGTRNAIETLITQFNENKSFTIFTFLPTNDDYTLKLNGLELYLEETYVPMEDLEQDTLDLITKLSTGALI